MNREELEQELLQYPILQYAFLKTDQISFLQRVRDVCKNECPRYGTSWSCPPAVGSVEECRKRCLEYEDLFVFTTIAEVSDITNMEETLATRMEHEEITRQITEIFKKHYGQALTLSTESCAICRKCAYPSAPCRHPDRMFPCVESYGILATELAELGGLDFMNGTNVVTWFSVVFHKINTE